MPESQTFEASKGDAGTSLRSTGMTESLRSSTDSIMAGIVIANKFVKRA